MTKHELYRILKNKDRDELNILARNLQIDAYRRKTAEELIACLLQTVEDKKLIAELKLNWWARYRQEVYTGVGFFLALIGIGLELELNLFHHVLESWYADSLETTQEELQSMSGGTLIDTLPNHTPVQDIKRSRDTVAAEQKDNSRKEPVESRQSMIVVRGRAVEFFNNNPIEGVHVRYSNDINAYSDGFGFYELRFPAEFNFEDVWLSASKPGWAMRYRYALCTVAPGALCDVKLVKSD